MFCKVARQKLPIVHHGDDVNALGTDTVNDAVRALQHLAQVCALVLRNLATCIGRLANLAGSRNQPFDDLGCDEGRVLRDVVVDKPKAMFRPVRNLPPI